jgi:NADPH:quinone reductase-like Zn-dependent oxidoreductase
MPEPGPNEVLVRVHYAALNRLDDWVRRGWKGLLLDFPHVPCSDFSGTIAAIGSDVTDWAVGQAVTANPLIWCGHCRDCLRGDFNRCRRAHLLGETIRGTCVEYIVVPAINLVAIPAGYDMQQAAAASLVYLTAWHSLIVAGGLRAAERVLVVGAGGGVNTAAVQIARHAGCDLFVVASNAEKARQARGQGAGWTHDRSVDPDWSRAAYLATNKEGMDLVVDNVGQATWRDSLRTLRPGGRLVTVGGTTGYEAALPVNLIFGRHLRIIGSTMGTQDDYQTVMALVFAQKLQPVVDSVYPLAEFRAAMARMLENRHFGKILIDVTAV